MVKTKKALTISILSALAIGILDYLVWVYYPNSDIIDAAVIGLAVFLIAFIGMRK
jgi:hypothetical protein